MRLKHLVAPLFAAAMIYAAPTQGQTEYTWSFIALDGGAAANLAGCEQCDDIDMALYCVADTDRVLITFTMDVKQGEDLDAADMTFLFDEETTIEVEGYLELNLMDDILQPIVETSASDPLITAFTSSKTLKFSVRGQHKDISLEGADLAVNGMLKACNGSEAEDENPSEETGTSG